MATLTTQQIGLTGTAVTAAAATSGGDVLQPGDHTFLKVKNGGGSPITVTVASPGVCSQGGTHNLVVSVAAGAIEDIGPLPAQRFADPADGLVHVTYSGVTTVTVSAVTI